MKATRTTSADAEMKLKERIKSKDASRLEKAKARIELLELKQSIMGPGYTMQDLSRELGESKSVTCVEINFAKRLEIFELLSTSPDPDFRRMGEETL